MSVPDPILNNGKFAPFHPQHPTVSAFAIKGGRAPTIEEEQAVLPEIVQAYQAGGHNLRALVKAIVTQPAYRRLP